MTTYELEKDLADSLKKDQLESVDVRVRVPRGVWVKMLQAMQHYDISHASDYISNLVRNDAEVRLIRARDVESSGPEPNPGGGPANPWAARAIHSAAAMLTLAIWARVIAGQL